MESKKLHNGKVVIIEADIYYNVDGNMTMHYTYPQDYIFITNSKGEVKIYFPSQNQVMLQHNQAFSSENDVLYCFLTLQTNDLGLKESGFSIQTTRYEDNLLYIRLT